MFKKFLLSLAILISIINFADAQFQYSIYIGNGITYYPHHYHYPNQYFIPQYVYPQQHLIIVPNYPHNNIYRYNQPYIIKPFGQVYGY